LTVASPANVAVTSSPVPATEPPSPTAPAAPVAAISTLDTPAGTLQTVQPAVVNSAVAVTVPA
jgi:hypothetical protein